MRRNLVATMALCVMAVLVLFQPRPTQGSTVSTFTPTGPLDAHPGDIYWARGFNIPGLDGQVCAMTLYDGKMIAGGLFSVACDTIARNIAAWDGFSWAPIGSGIDGEVRALAVYNGQLIATGDFLHAGGVMAEGIASWNGSTWSELGGGLYETSAPDMIPGTGTALTVYDGRLIVDFTVSGSSCHKGTRRFAGTDDGEGFFLLHHECPTHGAA